MAKMKTEDEMKLVMDMTSGVFDDDGWKTINGTHVLIEGGEITKGPSALTGQKSTGKKSSASKTHTEASLKRMTKAQILHELQSLGSSYDELETTSKESLINMVLKKQNENSSGSKASSSTKSAGSSKASYKAGSYEDKGVKFEIDAKGNRVAPGGSVPQVQVDISRTDGSQTFWTIRNGQRVEKTVPRSANLDKEMPKAIKALGLNMDDCYVKYS